MARVGSLRPPTVEQRRCVIGHVGRVEPRVFHTLAAHVASDGVADALDGQSCDVIISEKAIENAQIAEPTSVSTVYSPSDISRTPAAIDTKERTTGVIRPTSTPMGPN